MEFGSKSAHEVVLRAEGLRVQYEGPTPTRAVRDVSLELRRGEVLGIAGESGCGKSTLAYALTRLLRPPARLTSGKIIFMDRNGDPPVDIMSMNRASLREFRWSKVSMIFQSGMNALNPVTSLRKQFADIFEAHCPGIGEEECEQRSLKLLEAVGLDGARLRSYPHELSGGMRQRAGIAMALALNPQIIVMDEPTTALDVVVQREILDNIEWLRDEFGFSLIFISHDLALLLEMSDRLAVMYAGEVVEHAPADLLGRAPSHPYTRALLHSVPELSGRRRLLRGVPGSPPDLGNPIPGCAFAARCTFALDRCQDVHPDLGPTTVAREDTGNFGSWEVACHLHDPLARPTGPPPELAGGRLGSSRKQGRIEVLQGVSPAEEFAEPRRPGDGGKAVLEVSNLTVEFPQRKGTKLRAVDDVSFELHVGETLALVGESGSGKSTIALALARLIKPTHGQIRLDGRPAGKWGRGLRAYRRQVQLVFQDPFASLNPAFSVRHHLRRPLVIAGTSRSLLDESIEDLLLSVNLVPPSVFAGKRPHELSGGQRQRVSIARALAPRPSVLLADEPVSMLDVSVRLEILNLLETLKRSRNLALLYISHDLATARHFSTRIMVMYRGEVVESGPADEVILHPAHPYTQLLAASVPTATVDHEQLTAERRLRRETAERRAETGARAEALTPSGCRFADRCPHAMDVCAAHPPDFKTSQSHAVRCWLHDPSRAGASDASGSTTRPELAKRA